MNRILFLRLICITGPLLINSAKAQPDHFAYGVTAINKGGTEWVAIRKIDFRKGEYSPVLLNLKDKDPQYSPANSVAAIAYDRKNNRLFYTSMTIDQLRYIDLFSMESFPVADQFFSRAGRFDVKNSGPINRMVIAPDDFGYTITNDGTHLLRFNTNGSPLLTDLGDLIDDPKNKEMTIHSFCANSGGDLVADDEGHLFLITGYNKVYKVDIATKLTSYLGTVTGLPQKFTTSGAAVSEDGKKIIVSSVTYTDASFIIDPETWTASTLPATNEIIENADLANSNALYTKNNGSSSVFIPKASENGNRIKVFPNPVLEDEVSIQFNELRPGNYTIQLTSELGSRVLEQKAKITGHTQTEILHIPRTAAQGFYYIRILDEKNNVVGTRKLVEERL